MRMKEEEEEEEEDCPCGSSDYECNGDESDGFEELECDDNERGRPRRNSLKVIRMETLWEAQKEDLQKTMDLLSLKEHHARTLLIHYRWDVDMIFKVFVEKGKEQLFTEAGVTVMDSENIHSSESHLLFNKLCKICYEKFSTSDMTTMDCGHFFCNECWTEYFIGQVNKGRSKRLTCMGYQCNSVCDEEKIRSLVSIRDQKLAEKFDRFLLESYIDDNKSVRWCPSVPNCGNAIQVEDHDEYCELECICGMQFCFRCSAEAHSPCSCLMWELWMMKCNDESETLNWIIANSKNCPKCRKPAAKEDGCNLVICICGQPFCWLCGAATGTKHTWSQIDNHECRQFTKKHATMVERATEEIVRYTNYYNQYKAHLDSLQDEGNLKEKLQEKIDKVALGELASQDYSWMLDGFYRLVQSRRILLYSYPFSYFMFGGLLFKKEMTGPGMAVKQSLLEHLLHQLEESVNRLSRFLTEPFQDYSKEEFLEAKLRIIPLTAFVDTLCQNLYDCIENELLGSISHASNLIAPYRSKGIQKASEVMG